MNPLRSFTLRSGHFFFQFRNLIFPVALVFLFFTSKPGLFLGNASWDPAIVWTGIFLALAGQAFRLAVIGFAYIKRGGKEGKVWAERLVIRGFYAHSRNPMYLGNMLIVAGFCLMFGSWEAYALVLPFFGYAYLAITMAEEDFLRKKFGADYAAYEKNVNRFWPDFKGLADSLKEFEYDWKRAIRKDYGTVFSTLFGVIAIDLWKDCGQDGIVEGPKVFLAGAFFVLLVAFYLGARFLKKSGRLASAN
ncbi:MAG: isoprenylcysteine carboxylmethyltransferase family protein [Candidatus Omnitrophica bacterium]|nr:isoprenylcysteine carboxylmethyltransferase family protein [Candidatus Omnitrophota bacterium]